MVATPDIFPSTFPSHLAWAYRRPLILQELEELNADLICIQELQNTHADEFCRDMMQRGYETVYEANCGKGKEGRNFGLALFWRTDKFEKVHLARVYLKGLMDVLNKNKAMKTAKNASKELKSASVLHYKRQQVGLCISLREKNTGKLFILATTHIIAAWRDPTLQLLQTYYFVRKLLQFRTECAEKEPNLQEDAIPIILGGDFNTLPDALPYRYLMERSLDINIPEIAEYPYLIPYSLDEMEKAPVELFSAYSTLMQKEPDFTNYVGPSIDRSEKFIGTLDYIFYTQGLRPTSVLRIPVQSDLEAKKIVGLPTGQFPSDHFSLVAEFEFEE
eukprot:TRINITY_DN7851_c0_g1::TRINITY_DN7851_c0_g1_i1::g.23813::m.23813 TRINITY_DN7851_c0_g1::TRINITY_DN7851_c0_g1_i1::g.23813  ORF type:complete len:378 (-),score=22.23,sp/A8MS41/CCR4D_ARATH/29.72/5e-32,Exo_endo_phos/PF03372.18/1.3e-17 TRINITY_DN7851_c0_g1_i1:44-1039(-)